jgi:hypothetical protein
MKTERLKLVCEDCGWKGTDSQSLTAPNPFDKEDSVVGCPKCKAVNKLRTACDEPECWEEDTCGTPAVYGSSTGYRRTCGKHRPKEMKGNNEKNERLQRLDV